MKSYRRWRALDIGSIALDKYFRENYDYAPFKSKNFIILVKYG